MQITGVLREQETGATAAGVCRRHGISEQTFYWKANYGGMDLSDAQRLKCLEDENRRLKKLLADNTARCPQGPYHRHHDPFCRTS